jgi:hypothetical protein
MFGGSGGRVVGQRGEMNVELRDDVALVLFDLLFEYGSKDDGRKLSVQHPAEHNALWGPLGGAREAARRSVQPEYAELLSQARARLEDGGGPW